MYENNGYAYKMSKTFFKGEKVFQVGEALPLGTGRPVTSLGHQEGRRVFQEGPKCFELCPILLNCVNTFFQGGENVSRGGLPPASLVMGLGTGLVTR